MRELAGPGLDDAEEDGSTLCKLIETATYGIPLTIPQGNVCGTECFLGLTEASTSAGFSGCDIIQRSISSGNDTPFLFLSGYNIRKRLHHTAEVFREFQDN
jgi:hypothetical protein